MRYKDGTSFDVTSTINSLTDDAFRKVFVDEMASKQVILNRAYIIENFALKMKQVGVVEITPDDLIGFAAGLRRAAYGLA